MSVSTSLKGKCVRTIGQPREVRNTLSSKSYPLEEVPGSLSLATIVLCGPPHIPSPHSLTLDSFFLLLLPKHFLLGFLSQA